MSFRYVFIPCDPALPLEERTGDSSGGLTDDKMIASAGEHFASLAPPPGPVQSAASIRKDLISSGQCTAADLASVPDDLLASASAGGALSGPRAEITALTVPTVSNGYKGVSMYTGATSEGARINARASNLAGACGSASVAVAGDAFVSRYHDDEEGDVWLREDITAGECCDGDAEWIRTARKRGGGGGGGASRTTSGALSNMLSAGGGGQGGALPSPAADDGREQQAAAADGSAYFWSQTGPEGDDTVEIRVPDLPRGTKGKYVKVAFGARTVRATVAGKTVISGRTGGGVILDECTYLIQEAENNTKELCITLAKRRGGGRWPFAVEVGG